MSAAANTTALANSSRSRKPVRRPSECYSVSIASELATGGAEVLRIEDEFKTELLSVQSLSRFFRGFDDDEIEFISRFLSHFIMEDCQKIASAGEEASWVGILLTGEVSAITSMGDVLGRLQPGAIVGEVALFRGERELRSGSVERPECPKQSGSGPEWRPVGDAEVRRAGRKDASLVRSHLSAKTHFVKRSRGFSSRPLFSCIC